MGGIFKWIRRMVAPTARMRMIDRIRQIDKVAYDCPVFVVERKSKWWPFWIRVKGRFGCKYFLGCERAYEALEDFRNKKKPQGSRPEASVVTIRVKSLR